MRDKRTGRSTTKEMVRDRQSNPVIPETLSAWPAQSYQSCDEVCPLWH